MELQIVLNTFASEVFRKQADCDYISARANYRMQLRQQFLWSAQQCLEKYLKAILLFNGLSARSYAPPEGAKEKEFGHNLDALLSEVMKISILEIEIAQKDERFLSYLSSQGTNRYLSISAYNTSEVMHRLDSLVWNIRRYCQYIPNCGLGCSEVAPGMQKAVICTIANASKSKTPHRFKLFNGELEKIIERSPKDPARKALVWANLWYGSKRRLQVTYSSFSSAEVSPYDREWTNVDWNEIRKYIKPPINESGKLTQ